MQGTRPVSLEVALEWQSPYARHRDRTCINKVDLRRDLLPADLGEQLQKLQPGESAGVAIRVDDWLEPYQQSLIKTIRRDQFRRRSKHPVPQVTPRTGRFYPRSFVGGEDGIDSRDSWPLRCLQVDVDELVIDLNHPMAGRQLRVTTTLLQEAQEDSEVEDTASDILHTSCLNGPGMQAALPDVDTDFFSEDAFRRDDESPDTDFYASPRLVQHLDATCRSHITGLYARFLRPGMQVLDLMSSWVSHLPENLEDIEVHGLGLNAVELQANPHLAGYTCQDLNQEPALPFAEACFDAIVCTASIEYLVRPLAVMRELARVLKPGAPLVITFSDRWFPPKAIRLWSELHPYERLGLVQDYFRLSGAFEKLASESLRGHPRPEDDPYSDRLSQSDPLFAVWGYKITG